MQMPQLGTSRLYQYYITESARSALVTEVQGVDHLTCLELGRVFQDYRTQMQRRCCTCSAIRYK